MNRIMGWTVLFLVVILAGCAKPYAPPKENEAAAVVKLKFGYDAKKAPAALNYNSQNARISTSSAIVVQEGKEKETYTLTDRFYPFSMAQLPPSELEILAARIHPDKPVALSLAITVHWTERREEMVWKDKWVTKTGYEYDYSQKKNVMKSKQVNERYQVKEWVDKPFSAGCAAQTGFFTPEKDGVYLVDFSDPSITSGCTVQAYRQTPSGNGKFKLEPVGAAPATP